MNLLRFLVKFRRYIFLIKKMERWVGPSDLSETTTTTGTTVICKLLLFLTCEKQQVVSIQTGTG
jgi:hypothetical protein